MLRLIFKINFFFLFGVALQKIALFQTSGFFYLSTKESCSAHVPTVPIVLRGIIALFIVFKEIGSHLCVKCSADMIAIIALYRYFLPQG